MTDASDDASDDANDGGGTDAADAGTDASDAATPPVCPPEADPVPTTFPLPQGVCSYDGRFCEIGHLPVAEQVTRVWRAPTGEVWGTSPHAIFRARGGVATRGVVGILTAPIGGTSDSDVWIGGRYHWDGAQFTTIANPVPGTVSDVWFAASNDGWAVNGTNDAYHWDGVAWTASPTGAVAGVKRLLGFAGNDVWAVGGPSVRHWDGVAWSEPTPLPAGETADLVGGAATNDFWVSGSKSYHYSNGAWTAGGVTNAIAIRARTTTDVTFIGPSAVQRWNGTIVFPEATPTSNCNACGGCTDVAKGTTDIFSAAFPIGSPNASNCPLSGNSGGTGAFAPTSGAILELDGQPVMRRSGKIYKGVTSTTPILWGVSNSDTAVDQSQWGANDVWVTGYLDTLSMASHYDGVAWTYKPLPERPTSAVGAASPTSAWVLMGSNMAYFDGAAWTTKGTGAAAMVSIWGSSDSDAWGVGKSGLISHWDGVAWTKVPAIPTTLDFTVVRGRTANDVVAVAPGSSSNALAHIFHFDGVAWTEVATHMFAPRADQNTSSYAVFAPDDIWLAGRDTPARMSHWDGKCWSTTLFPASSTPEIMIGGSPSVVWASSTYDAVVTKP